MSLPTKRTKADRQKALKRAEKETPAERAARHKRLDDKRKEAHKVAREARGE